MPTKQNFSRQCECLKLFFLQLNKVVQLLPKTLSLSGCCGVLKISLKQKRIQNGVGPKRILENRKGSGLKTQHVGQLCPQSDWRSWVIIILTSKKSKIRPKKFWWNHPSIKLKIVFFEKSTFFEVCPYFCLFSENREK